VNDKLDRALSALREEPPSAKLDVLEARVLSRIDGIRQTRAAQPMILALRVGGMVGALGLGVLSSGFTAAALATHPREVSAFSINAELAPSTLLDR
jgi:hypothetical protein